MSAGVMSSISGWPVDVGDAGGVVGPDARVAVGLQLDAHGVRGRTAVAALHAGGRAQQVLHVVAVLVGDDVGAGEVAALRAEAGLQLLVEGQVDVDVLVGGAVERPGVRGGGPAAGVHVAGEELGARRRVALAGAGERVAPVVVDGVDDGDDLAVELRVGLRARLARRRRGVGPCRLPVLHALQAARHGEPATSCAPAAEELEQQEDDDADDPQAAAADRDPPAEPTAPTPAGSTQVVDVGRVQLGVLVESHRGLPGERRRDPITPDVPRSTGARPVTLSAREAWQSGRMHSP